jgi:predicted DNA-binding transcriptional regulator AlpA
MQPPFNDDFKEIAEGMGISLYQRFSPAEAALFLRISLTELRKLMKRGKVNFIEVGSDKSDFFGYQLLEYLLSTVTNNKPVAPMPKTPDRIIRAKEVQDLTGLSRTTLWRMENKGEFPRRVSLGGNLVGWRWSEISQWIDER